eukprot:s4893_g1.t1
MPAVRAFRPQQDASDPIEQFEDEPPRQQPVRPTIRAGQPQPKQRAEALQRAVQAERQDVHRAVQAERQEAHRAVQQGQQAASAGGSSGYGQQPGQGDQVRELTTTEVDGLLRQVARNHLFQHPPRVRDGWHQMEVVELYGKRYQVVMRNHRTTRRKSFHPVHRGAPGNLLGRRLTVTYGGGGRSEVDDDWSETWETSGWTGYTLFLQRKGEVPDRPAQQRQNSAPSAAATQGSSWSTATTRLVKDFEENGKSNEVLHYAANGEGGDIPPEESERERPERSRSPATTGANESLLDDMANYDLVEQEVEREEIRLQCGISSLTARAKTTPRQIEYLDPNSGYVRYEDPDGNRGPWRYDEEEPPRPMRIQREEGEHGGAMPDYIPNVPSVGCGGGFPQQQGYKGYKGYKGGMPFQQAQPRAPGVPPGVPQWQQKGQPQSVGAQQWYRGIGPEMRPLNTVPWFAMATERAAAECWSSTMVQRNRPRDEAFEHGAMVRPKPRCKAAGNTTASKEGHSGRTTKKTIRGEACRAEGATFEFNGKGRKIDSA